jgi:histidinol-phosphatase (PHP family)
MICNYHTHTYRCKHALGDVDDYVEAAIEFNADCLGISDHTPLPDNRWLGVRMHMDELQAYSDSIDTAKLRYHDQIHILKGMECDWAPEYAEFYQTELLGKYKFDYLIGASHWFPFDGEWQMSFDITTSEQVMTYADFYADAIASGIFSFMAHPDVFCAQYEWDEAAVKGAIMILETAEHYNIPLEINGYGFRKPKSKLKSETRTGYPYFKFWEIAANYDIKVFCNSDAHLPNDVISGIAEASALAKQFNLQQVVLG